MTIKLTPEYWSQPGAVTYTHVHKENRTVCNVDSIDPEKGCLCWSIGAWGNTSQWYVPFYRFLTDYDAIENPKSMYDAMDEAERRAKQDPLNFIIDTTDKLLNQ